MVLSVSQFVSSLLGQEEEETKLIPQSLNLSDPDRELLERGVCSYLLPGQQALQLGDSFPSGSAFEKYVSPEILKVCSVPHMCVLLKSPLFRECQMPDWLNMSFFVVFPRHVERST